MVSVADRLVFGELGAAEAAVTTGVPVPLAQKPNVVLALGARTAVQESAVNWCTEAGPITASDAFQELVMLAGWTSSVTLQVEVAVAPTFATVTSAQ